MSIYNRNEVLGNRVVDDGHGEENFALRASYYSNRSGVTNLAGLLGKHATSLCYLMANQLWSLAHTFLLACKTSSHSPSSITPDPICCPFDSVIPCTSTPNLPSRLCLSLLCPQEMGEVRRWTFPAFSSHPLLVTENPAHLRTQH
eukprot:748400-Hanusia_phi.AAC.3